jgi:N-methylhydantoinase A
MSSRVSMDIGGTFTDIVVYDERDGSYLSGKLPTTPDDPAEGVVQGVRRILPSLQEIAFTVHGTTVGLNAFLQRRGERVLLLATAGASDTYLIARGTRTKLYELHFRKPTPLIPRSDIVPIGGRLDYRGVELEPLEIDRVEEAARRAQLEGVRSIAVAFLFAYLNPAHEIAAEAAIHAVYPEASVSLSHRVAREWREYERTSSTVFDAYIAPVVSGYLGRLEDALGRDGLKVPLHVMQSSGGVLTAATAKRRPIQTLLSGPAGGTMGGVALARLMNRPNLLCVDMGGTSFDVSLVIDGKPDITQETALEGLPLLMPIINIHTIGAGGGSIGYSEAGGLRVGPESAGADPGPACYGHGGVQPTVTDANLVVGRIDPSSFLGGQMHLNVDAAESAIAALASELDLDPIRLAEGMLDVVNAKMAQAIRTITVEEGIEPRDFAIVAFGGAGPMHAVFLARELEIRQVIVPPNPGAFSAWGMLQTPLRHDLSRSYYVTVDEADGRAVAREFAALARDGSDALEAEGVPRRAIETLLAVEMRYVGQEYTVNVPVELNELTGADFRSTLERRFDDAHERRYGHANRGAPTELVVLRVTAIGDLVRTPARARSDGGTRGTPFKHADVTFLGRVVDIPFFRREELGVGMSFEGPAIVEEPTATTVVPPDTRLRVDVSGSLVLDLEVAP